MIKKSEIEKIEIKTSDEIKMKIKIRDKIKMKIIDEIKIRHVSPAHPHADSFDVTVCGALSVPIKNLVLPEVAAFNSEMRCFSLFKIGKQNI